MKRLFDMGIRVCNSLEDHFDAIRNYVDGVKDERSEQILALQNELDSLDTDLQDAEYERDDFEEKYEKIKKQRDQILEFIRENGLESKLQTYLTEKNNMN